ncbi:MAG TPA: NAD(P)/FAD-dependent oxidoreductase [Candidatus Bathyarchaeia archaeon]|nr:NAD(P)/FAD-dependent oxidoreductase [Candidatus Bathyarchaeia archaeon]
MDRSKVQTQADVVVVGAGPAGSFAALTAAKLGNDVVICEEHSGVGLPSHCAGHISIKGLNQVGLRMPEKAMENKIASAIFYSPSGNEFRVRLPSPVTYVINRSMFDKHLAQLAEQAGAKLLLGTKAEELLMDQGSVQGISLKNAKRLKSKIVINAEGCASTLLKQVGLQTFDKSMVVNAVNGEVDSINGLEHDTVEVFLGQKYAPGLYAWIIPKQDGSAKVGLATKHGNPKEHLNHFLSTHPVARKKIRFSDVKNLSFHLIPLGGPIPRTYHNGFLVVGDAASHVKPTTGGGVVMGLTCAKIAGETASEAVQNNNSSEDFLSRYQIRCQRAIGFDMMAMRQMRLMLNRLSDKKLDAIVNLCQQFKLNEELRKVKDIDFQGKSTLQLLKSPSAWAVALYSLVASLTS